MCSQQLQILHVNGNARIAASSTDTAASLNVRVQRATGDVTGSGPPFCLCHAEGDTLTLLDESQSLAALGIRDGARLFARRPHHAKTTTFEAIYQTTEPGFLQPRLANS
ncbi:unnamed protein product [Durusdinium trenchii]|uniref:Ubiquitin-like domain-containing protein n=1 Tax=Durusdinium trenchii TaxID=1381693 RepID=A0ABP0PZ06_9DINO